MTIQQSAQGFHGYYSVGATQWSVDSDGDIRDGEMLIAEPSYLSKYGRKNATLIAASPELLALLVEIVSELSDNDDEGLIEHTEWMMNARATIAKAKGEEVKDDTINPPYAVVPPIDKDKKEKCDCCERAEKYNGLGSGPILFHCPKNCWCHD